MTKVKAVVKAVDNNNFADSYGNHYFTITTLQPVFTDAIGAIDKINIAITDPAKILEKYPLSSEVEFELFPDKITDYQGIRKIKGKKVLAVGAMGGGRRGGYQKQPEDFATMIMRYAVDLEIAKGEKADILQACNNFDMLWQAFQHRDDKQPQPQQQQQPQPGQTQFEEVPEWQKNIPRA